MAVAAVLGALGAIANLVSPLLAKQRQPSQINPLTDQRLQDLLAQATQFQGQINQLGGEAQAARTGQRAAAGEAGRLGQAAEDVVQPSANAWFNQYLSNVPEYMEIAEEVKTRSMEQFGRDLDQQRVIDMEQAMRAAGDATAGQGFSGAAASAAGQAAGQVVGGAALQRSQMAADIFGQTFNQLSGQGQGLAFQDTQMQFQNALAALNQALTGVQTQGGLLGQAGGQAIQQQGNIAGLLGQTQQNIQDITQPVYSSPTTVNKFGGAGESIAALGQFIEGGQQQNMMAQLLAALQGAGTSPSYSQTQLDRASAGLGGL